MFPHITPEEREREITARMRWSSEARESDMPRAMINMAEITPPEFLLLLRDETFPFRMGPKNVLFVDLSDLLSWYTKTAKGESKVLMRQFISAVPWHCYDSLHKDKLASVVNKRRKRNQ